MLKVVEEFEGLGFTVLGVPCHVGKAEDRARLVDATLSRFGRIDVVVSNAAVQPSAGLTLDADSCCDATWLTLD